MTHFRRPEFPVGCNRVSPELPVPLKDSGNCIGQYLHTHMRAYVRTEKFCYQTVPVFKTRKFLLINIFTINV